MAALRFVSPFLPRAATTPLSLALSRRYLSSQKPKLAAVTRRRRRLPFLDFDQETSAEQAVNNILYNTPESSPSAVKRHTLNCLVSNEPGVLSRISGILAARGFNIDSLVVAKTEVADLSRMTIVINGNHSDVDQARSQLEDLVPVWAVLDYTYTKVVERELLLVKVWTLPQHLLVEHQSDLDADEAISEESPEPLSPLLTSHLHRASINELASLFSARIVDVAHDAVVVELCAKPDRIDAFLKLLKPYGIVEVARSGTMAMPRAPVEGVNAQSSQKSIDEESHGGAVDATMLPPG
ncbi:acetolactate synthase [Cladochytrium replicatum]|nr:acetolactate synthase [Cladochytrium replicatum]